MAHLSLLFLAAALSTQGQQAGTPQSDTARVVASAQRGTASSTRARATVPGTIMAARTAQGIMLDGRVDEPAWHGAPPVTGFTQKDPDEGHPASQRTEVRVVYDEDAIYIGGELFDTAPDSIVSQLARRDRFIPADRFFVFLDPYRDGRTGFYFGVNAAGTLYDGTLYNDSWDDDTWDGIWDAKVVRTDRGWSVEMRIPYSQLRFQGRPEHIWGVNFRRDIARNSETAWVVYTPKNGSGFVSRFPELRGITGVRPSRRLEIMPYLTARAEYLSPTEGDPFNDGSSYSPSGGVDVKLGI